MPYSVNVFARTIVEDVSAQESIDMAVPIYPRLNDLYEGLKWRLARRPAESGVKLSRDSDKYITKTLDWSQYNIPALRVIYSFNENETVIMAIDILPVFN